MFDIIYPRNGAVLNHNHGIETEDGLEIGVRGMGGIAGVVKVNGIVADFDGTGFSARIKLKEQFNTITAEMEDSYGKTVRQIKVVWDKASFKRYNFFIDDHSFLFTDLARERPARLFDHFYLKFLRSMNEKYGAKFTLNTFFKNAHDKDGFTLKDMPDCYRGEWQDAAGWLRLAFHAYSEFPDRIYQNTDAATLASDYDLTTAELIRIAGEETVDAPVGLHWGMCRPEAFKALTDRGVRALEGQFMNPRTGIFDDGSASYVCDVGYFVNLDEARYIQKNGIYYDFSNKLAFFKGDCTANLWTCEQIVEKMEIASQGTRDYISMASHEQYSFPCYFNYLPDHFQRIETSIRIATEKGYKPVFFAEGFLGNLSWEA